MSLPGCNFCEPRLRALLDGELRESEAARVREHLTDCVACQEELAVITQVTHLTGLLPGAIEPPPHFGAALQVRLASVRRRQHPFAWLGVGAGAQRLRWSRRYSLAGVTMAGTILALIFGAPPRLGARDLVGLVQDSWRQLDSYSCHFVSEAIVAGHPRRFEQQQWFRKPNLFRLETNEHYHERTYLMADRVVTYIPGADWHGKRLAITRPRRAREEGLPFPFGAEWPLSYDVTMNALVSELKSQQGGELLGTEGVLGKLCYVLKFHTQRPGSLRPKHYLVWVDRDSFLPLKIKTYVDMAHQSVSVANGLQTNVMMPSDTFRFTPSRDTFQVYGEVEPFVFTMPFDRPRTADFDTDPVGTARSEILRRARYLDFQPLAPGYLPDGYVLVRVRRSRENGWLDAYWLHERTGAVIQLREDPVRSKASQSDEETAGAQAGSPGWARCREVRRPAPVQYVSWSQGGARLHLAAAGVDRLEALRIAASLSPVEEPGPQPEGRDRSDPRPQEARATEGSPSLHPTRRAAAVDRESQWQTVKLADPAARS